MQERWLPVPVSGYEPVYSVSDRGRVRREIDATNGVRAGFVLKSIDAGNGYLRVMLRHRGRSKTVSVHRLVLGAFVGPCPPGYQSHHKDGDKANNTLENLEYVTPRRNSLHATRVLGRNVGEGHTLSKLTAGQVTKIRCLYLTGAYTQRDIASWFNVSQCLIHNIVTRKTWRHIP